MQNEKKNKRVRKTKTGRRKRGLYKAHRGEIIHAADLTLVLRRLKGLVGSRGTLPDDPVERKRNEADLLEIYDLTGQLIGPEHYNIYQEVIGR